MHRNDGIAPNWHGWKQWTNKSHYNPCNQHSTHWLLRKRCFHVSSTVQQIANSSTTALPQFCDLWLHMSLLEYCMTWNCPVPVFALAALVGFKSAPSQHHSFVHPLLPAFFASASGLRAVGCGCAFQTPCHFPGASAQPATGNETLSCRHIARQDQEQRLKGHRHVQKV